MKIMKNVVSKFNSINKGVVAKVSVLSSAMMMAAAPAFAATATDVNLVDGTIKLIKDGLTWVLALVPISAILMIGYHGWMKSLADGDPSAVSDRNKKMKNVAIGSAIAVCTTGLVKIFLAYYNTGVSGTIGG